MPKVTVVIPCYNQGGYIDEAVDSVLAQRFDSYEIIIVNDGSTDEATNVKLATYKKPSTRVLTTENQGPSMARNAGIRAASGEYILPLDADDKIAPGFLSKSAQVLDEQPEVGIVCSLVQFFGARNGRFFIPDFSEQEMLVANHVCVTALFRKCDWEQVGGYNSNMIYGWEDWDFWLSLIDARRKISRIPEVLFYYRTKSSSRTTKLSDEKQRAMYRQLFVNHANLYTQYIDQLFLEAENRRSSLAYHIKTRLNYFAKYWKSWL